MDKTGLGAGRIALGAALVLVTAWTGLVNSFNVEHFSGEVGHFLDASRRIWAGEVPHLDFICPYGPLLYYPDAVLFKLLGSNWFASQFAVQVAHPLACLALVALSALFSTKGARHVFAFFLASWLIGLQGATFRFWLPLAALSFLHWSARRFSTWGVMVSAFLCGLSFYVSPETGIAAVGGAVPLVVSMAVSKDRTWVQLLGALVFSLLLGLVYPPFFGAYLLDVWGLARFSNYYAGLPLPLPGFSLETYVWYAPPIFAVAVAGRNLFLLLRRMDDSKTAERVHTLGIAVFALLMYRYALGRSDYGHLLCVMPAFLLLLFRLVEKSPSSGIVLFFAVLPYFSATVREDYFYRVADLRLSSREGYVEFAEEGIWAPGLLVKKTRAISAFVRERTGENEPVLFQPLPFHAHFARRPSALPSLLAEQIVISGHPPERVVDRVDSSGARYFVLDRVDIYPGAYGFIPPKSFGPLSGYIGWASPAGEVILREFREYLEANFEPLKEIGGAVIFSKRKKALSVPAMVEVARIPVSREQRKAMARGQTAEFPMPECPYDEIRIPIRASYPWGLASLAKTNLELVYAWKAGLPYAGLLPVPPRALGKYLRFRPACGYPAVLRLSISTWGAMVPPPVGVELDEIAVMRMPSIRETRRGRQAGD